MRILATVPPPPFLPLPCERFYPFKAGRAAWKVRVGKLRIVDAERQRLLTDVHRPYRNGLAGDGRYLEARFPKAGPWLE